MALCPAQMDNRLLLLLLVGCHTGFDAPLPLVTHLTAVYDLKVTEG
jgi:hypothetical protein